MFWWMTYCLQLCVCQMKIDNIRWGDLPSTKSASGTSWRNQILQLRPRFHLQSILSLIIFTILIFNDHSFDDNLDDTRPCHCLCLCCSYLSLSKDVSLSLLLYLWLRLYLCLYCSYLSLSQAVSFISFIFVVVSTVGMTLNTMPSMRHRLPSLSRFIFFAKTEIEQSVKKCLWHPPPPQQPCQPPDRGQPPPRPRRSHLHLLVHPRVPPQVGGSSQLNDLLRSISNQIVGLRELHRRWNSYLTVNI